MSKPVKPLSLIEVKNELTSALRGAALRPTIFGYKPQDQQIPFHQSQARGKLAIGGNRSGKTVAGATEAVKLLTGRHEFNTKFALPVRGRAVGVDFDNGVDKIMLPEIKKWMPISELINGSWDDSYSKGTRTLTLANGSTLEFMSYDQDVDKFAGTSRHFIWFDEEPPEDIFNECMLRLVDTAGNWFMTMTPLIDMSWTLDRLFLPGTTKTNPDIEVFEMLTSSNPYVNSAEMEILTRGMDEDQQEARRSGKYATYAGAIYSDVITSENFIETILTPEKWPFYYSQWGHFGMLDHGHRVATAFLLGCYNEHGTIIIYDEYYQERNLVYENAEEIKKKLQLLNLQDKIEYMVADPSIDRIDPIAGGSIRAAYAENGLYFSMANNDVTAGIERVASRFKLNELFITSNCVKTKWELGRYRWKKHLNAKVANRNNLLEGPLKKDDHACDALRYGVVSRPTLPGEKEMRTGNILNSPVAIDDSKTVTHMDLVSNFGNTLSDSAPYHAILGDDY